ncbi:hypothetical protein K439DRAFT_870090 [Ramaria rubella]|nr:hypothetical protein K439DRAFT_870090 [Ramaria rubella]
MKHDRDDELGSWGTGSGSDWSHGGDVEDSPCSSYGRAASEPPDLLSTPSTTHPFPPNARFPALSHAPIARPDLYTCLPLTHHSHLRCHRSLSASAPSRSRKDTTPKSVGRNTGWEGRQREDEEGYDASPRTPSRWVRRHDSKINVQAASSQPKEPSHLNRVNVGVSAASSPPPPQPLPRSTKPAPLVLPSRPLAQLSTPMTPDLTFSSLSPASTLSPTPPPPAPNLITSPTPKPKAIAHRTPLLNLHSNASSRQSSIPTMLSLMLPIALPRETSSTHELQLKTLQHVSAVMLRDLHATLFSPDAEPEVHPPSVGGFFVFAKEEGRG